MCEQFDPYHQWLGIPPKEQPPDLYRLLGITLFEEHPSVIEAAADRQMGHLRSYQTGSHSALSQKLLNEIAAARVCLLDPAKKAVYDQKLRQETEPAAEVAVVPIQVTRSVGTPRHNRSTWLVSGALAAVVLACTVFLLWPSSRTMRPSSPEANGSAREPVADVSPSGKLNDKPTARPVATPGNPAPEIPKTAPLAPVETESAVPSADSATERDPGKPAPRGARSTTPPRGDTPMHAATEQGEDNASRTVREARPVEPAAQSHLLADAGLTAEPVNLGPNVNSKQWDLTPTLSGDGRALLFASSRAGGLGREDLWMCVRTTTDEEFGPPINLGSTVNSHHLERGPALSPDGRTLIFYSFRPGGIGNEDLWMCSRASMSEPFGVPVNLGPNVNTPAAEVLPAFSVDGRIMFFTSDRPGGTGGSDLWIATRASTNLPFGRPSEVGPPINSEAYEAGSAMSASGLTLVFCSSRPGGQGDKDLWMSVRKSLEKPFGAPVNLGPVVNSKQSDRAPALSPDGRLLLFESNRPGGYGGYDLWMVEFNPAELGESGTASTK